MLKIKILGGLGNQMFQYATARALNIKYSCGLTLNTGYFKRIPKRNSKREYGLDKFNIDKNVKTEDRSYQTIDIIQNICVKIFGEWLMIKLCSLFVRCGLPATLYGYFQKEKYFLDIRHILLKEFLIKDSIHLREAVVSMRQKIDKTNAVCINVRRGDYLKPRFLKIYGILDHDYYKKAIEYIGRHVQNPIYYIFYDDPDFAKRYFSFKNSVLVGIDLFSDYEQMHLMCGCKHNILANSSFAWWGAWLNQNPNKIVVAPRRWNLNKDSQELEILPKDWVQI